MATRDDFQNQIVEHWIRILLDADIEIDFMSVIVEFAAEYEIFDMEKHIVDDQFVIVRVGRKSQYIIQISLL